MKFLMVEKKMAENSNAKHAKKMKFKQFIDDMHKNVTGNKCLDVSNIHFVIF